MEQTQDYWQLIEKIDKIYDICNEMYSYIRKSNSSKSKFEEAVDYIKSLPQINVHISKAAELIYPKIYLSRPKAQSAIKKMVSLGILKLELEHITKGNTS